MNQLVTYKDTANVGPATNVATVAEGGLFSKVAQDPLISAVVGLRSGFESRLPVRYSRIENPTVGIITGIDEDSDPSGNDCNIYPTAGLFKMCYVNNYPFAKYGMKSRSVDLTEVGQVDNNWTNANATITGNPFAPTLPPSATNAPAGAGAFGAYQMLAQRDDLKAYAEMMFSASVSYGRECLYGNPANDVTTNSIKHMRGLSLLINDNYSDAVTGVDCARVDSKIIDFSGKSVEANTNELVGNIIDMIALFEARQKAMGFQERWDGFLVMHPNLFRKLVFAWPATFASYRTALNTSTEARVDAMMLQNQRIGMLQGSYLIGDMGNIEVVQDISVIEDVDLGVYTSDIWFVNRRVNNTPTTYVEYLPLNNPATARGAIETFGASSKYSILDNGKFLTFWQSEGTCVRSNMVWRPRLRVDTPFLCGAINDIDYTPNFVINETPYPSDSGYISGGVTGPYAGAPGTEVSITACADDAAGELTFTVDEAFNCDAAGGVQVVFSDGLVIPAVISAGAGTTSVSVDFTTAATPTTLQAVACADFTFVGATLRCPYRNQ
ncbi:MAG: hypothetical protein KDD89_03885 [Anaerolineales bacterium]|nr:hypothetical protein [Anaerolineales bacterium]